MSIRKGTTPLGRLFMGSTAITRVYRGPELVFGDPAPQVFPYALPYVNPDSSDPSNAMFEVYRGSGPGRNGANFSGSANQSLAAWGQTLDIPSEYWPGIDMRRVKVTAGVNQVGWSGDTDNGHFYVEAFDANLKSLGISKYEGYNDPASLTLYEYSFYLPPQTRKIRIATRNRRNSGTENSIYYTGFYGDLTFEETPDPKKLLYALDPNTLDGWTQVVGTLVAGSTNNIWNQPQLKFSADEFGHAHRTVPLPVEDHSAVDAGTYNVDITTWAVDFSGAARDRSYFTYEFRDAADAVISTISTHSTYTDTSAYDIEHGIQFKDHLVPVGTRSIRINYYGDLNDGANLDAGPSRIIIKGGLRETPLFPTISTPENLRYHFAADEAAYSDAGITPVADGDPVYQWTNLGEAPDDALQPELTNRPIWRANGLNGRPYVEASHLAPHFFEDLLEGNQTSGGLNGNNYTVIVVADQIPLGHTGFLFGVKEVSSASAAKAGVWFTGSQEMRWYKSQVNLACPNPGGANIMIGRRTSTTNFASGHQTRDLTGFSQATNSTSEGSVGLRFLRHGSTPGAFFSGRIYEVLWFNSGMAAADVNLIRDYLRQKYAIYT